jgi:hypothetical protein
MIFFVSVQLALSVMGLIPMSEGLSLIEISWAGVWSCTKSGEGADLDESKDVGTMDLAMDEMMEAVLEGSRVDDDNKRWVRM